MFHNSVSFLVPLRFAMVYFLICLWLRYCCYGTSIKQVSSCYHYTSYSRSKQAIYHQLDDKIRNIKMVPEWFPITDTGDSLTPELPVYKKLSVLSSSCYYRNDGVLEGGRVIIIFLGHTRDVLFWEIINQQNCCTRLQYIYNTFPR